MADVIKIDFQKIRNLSDLSKRLACDKNDLQSRIQISDQSKYFKKMDIPKKNRKLGYRTVYQCTDMVLSQIHKYIASSINITEMFPEYVRGFVVGGSCTKNAKMHLAKKYLLHADIIHFFESFSLDSIVKVFLELGCNEGIAKGLSKLCTLNGVLVQGINSSPVLANFACKQMDEELNALSLRYGCKYSRYADDITISGNNTLPEKREIEEIFSTYDFRMNDRKYKIQKRGMGQYVTGLTVFDDKAPRVPKRFKKNLRLELYYAKKYGLMNHLKKSGVDIEQPGIVLYEIYRIKGWIDYIKSVEPDLAIRYYEAWNVIIDRHVKELYENKLSL